MITSEALEKEAFRRFDAKSYKGAYCAGLWQKRVENKFFINFYIYEWPSGSISVECEGHFYFEGNTVSLTIQNPTSIPLSQGILARFFSAFNCEPLDD